MIFEKLLQGQPEGIFGIGYNDPSLVGVICTCILLVLVICGVRVVIAASIAGIIGLVELIGVGPALGNIGAIPYSKSVTFVLGLLPIFILIGFLAYQAGITRQLFEAAKAWVGFVPGGLAVATVFATAGFAAVSGASTATAAVFSRIAIPEMLKEGYDKKLAAGVVAAGGTLASLIPPSAILIIYAIIVEESVGALLLAGFLPGVFSAIVYALIIILWAKKNPKLGPPSRRYTLNEKLKTLPGILPIAVVADDAVFALEQQEYHWVVNGIDSVNEYVRLKNIFEDLEFIDTFFLEKLSVDQVLFSISTRASEKKIVELLAKRKVLVENPFYRGPGLGFKIGEGFN